MRKSLILLAFSIGVFTIAFAQSANPSSSSSGAQAQDILNAARAAFWSNPKAPPLKSFVIQALRRYTRNGQQYEVEMTLEALLPDKLLQTDSVFMSVGVGQTTVRAVNGAQAWYTSENDSTVKASKKMITGGQVGSGKAVPPWASEFGFGGNVMPKESSVTQGIHASLARLLLVCLLTTSTAFPIEFTYAGQAVAPDGKQADVLQVTGPNGFATQLFLHPQTHQVMMLSYQARKRAKGEDGRTGTFDAEMRWTFSEYRNVEGWKLPHLLIVYMDGKPVEEVTIRKVKLNPSLKPEKFSPKQ